MLSFSQKTADEVGILRIYGYYLIVENYWLLFKEWLIAVY